MPTILEPRPRPTWDPPFTHKVFLEIALKYSLWLVKSKIICIGNLEIGKTARK